REGLISVRVGDAFRREVSPIPIQTTDPRRRRHSKMNCKPPSLIRCALFLPLACFAVQTCHAQYVIDSLDGEVTQHEVDTFLSNVTALPIPTIEDPGTSHNYLADGPGGVTLEAMNDLYVITGDIPSLSSEHTQL